MSFSKTYSSDSLLTYIFLGFILVFIVYTCCECCVLIRKPENNFNSVSLHNECFEELTNLDIIENADSNNNINLDQNRRNFNHLVVI